jgi:hypothetical protein
MDPTAPHWLYYPTVDDDVGTDVGIDAIAVDGGWINGVDGYTQNEITIGGGAAHYFVKVVYSNYTWNAASTLKLTLAPKGDGTGSIDVEPLTADLDRFFLDEANNTVYYFGGATIATGLSANGTAPWLQNARFAAGTMDITASIVEGSTTKISQKTGKVEWKTFEAPTLTDNLTIPADTVAVIPAGTTFTVPSNKTLTIKGTLIVNGTLIGDVQGNGTTAAEWGKISYPATGIGSNSNPMVIDTDDKFTFGGSASAPTVAWTGGHLHIAAGKVVTIPAGAKWTFTTGYNAGVLGTLNVVGDLIVAGTLTVSDDGILTGTVQGNGQQQSDWGKISYPAVGIGTTNPMAMDTYDIITFGVASGVKTVTWVGGHLHIPSGNTTTIPEGAAWVFTTNYYLDVLGTLIVNGAFDVSSGTVINTGALIVGATGTLNIGTAARTDVFNEFASITATEEGGAGAGVKYTSTGSNYSGATFTITTGATVIRGESAPTLGTLYTGYTFGADGKLAYSGT